MVGVLSLQEARGAVRLPTSDSTRDGELASIYIPAVTKTCEYIAGPIMTATRSFTTWAGVVQVQLPDPFQSIVSVKVNDTVWPAESTFLIPEAGIVGCGRRIAPYPFPPGEIAIDYTVGYAASESDVLPAHKLAARIILATQWQADQQGNRSQSTAPGEVLAPTGFLIPYRALQLLQITPGLGGFA